MLLLIIGFYAGALLLVAAMHWYLWLRLVRDTTRPHCRARRNATITLIGLALILAGALVGSDTLPLAGQRIIAWPGYLWMAVAFYLLVVLLAVDLGSLALRLLPHRRRPWWRGSLHPTDPTAAADEGRRLVLARAVAVGAGLVAAATVGVGTRTALGPPVRRRLAIPLARWPSRLDGLRIALVADIHAGPALGEAYVQRVVTTVNDLAPDLVAVVGDLADGNLAEARPALEPLTRLRSRLGAFFVSGNHEYYEDAKRWRDEATALGLRVLRNERVAFDGWYLAGVNDADGTAAGDPPDYERALGGRDPALPVVLLAHQPVQARAAARYGVDLQLSGHTHGGQMWPLRYLVGLQQPVLTGLGSVDNVPVYVTRGAGFWGTPVRVGCPPDVTLVVLRAT